MSCISMSNDESLIYVVVSRVFHIVKFSAFWRPENAISAQSSKGFIKSMILDIIVLGLEISVNSTSFSM